jgi:phosphohistidine phosphatase
LIVLRHAKSAWPDMADHDRPLAPRGRRDAPAVGRWLRDAGCEPDLVVCSTARRTRETWELAAPELADPPPVVYEARVYDATVPVLLDVVGETPQRCGTLLLIGHNPGVQQLTLHLATAAAADGDGGDGDLRERAATKFPTSAVAVLTWAGTWTAPPGGAKLAAFAVPRGAKR